MIRHSLEPGPASAQQPFHDFGREVGDPHFTALHAVRETGGRDGNGDSAPTILASSGLQGIEECDQVSLLWVGELDGEAGVVEVHHLAEVGGQAVVKVVRARGEPVEHWAFELADVLPPPGEQRADGAHNGDGALNSDVARSRLWGGPRV